jgi:hypothetical protein
VSNDMSVDRYDKQFFDYMANGSIISARVVVPLIRSWLKVESVMDVGCGQGAWLKVWREQGVDDLFGLDGDYVDPMSLFIPEDRFQATELDRPFALDRRFDLVTSLEVAEHLPHSAAENLVECLCAHADHVLFSAAVPGQGGANHINEQPYGYWKDHFAARGFKAFDCIRPAIRQDGRVKPWYRYNTFLYVDNDACAALPESIRATMLAPGVEPVDCSPFWYKARKALIRQLPLRAVNRLAVINERWTRL